MASNLLTDVEVRSAKPSDKPRRLSDGNGLALLIHPNGSKYFQLRYTLHEKEKTLQLGIYPDMKLADARVKAMEARNLIAEGKDPVVEKWVKAAQIAVATSTTFKIVADQWLAIKQRTLAPSSHRKIKQTFSANVFPRFGTIPIGQIDAKMVRSAMLVMEKRGALELMEKCRAWIRDVFEFALAESLIPHNPIPAKDLVLKKHRSESHPRLKNREDAGKFLRNLFEYQGRVETRIAIWLQMLIATRPGELRLAEWSEFDLDKALWTIPIERMKTRQHMTEPHVVTLSKQAVTALKELHEVTSYSKLAFPSLTNANKPMSDMTLSKALRGIWPDYRIVPHGFRHFFSTMANEQGHFRPDVIEAALAHKDSNTIHSRHHLPV